MKKSTLKKIHANLSMFKANSIITDEQLCSTFNLAIPSVPADRIEATKVLGNFQLQKGFLVSAINKALAKHNNTQLSQSHHTNYKVVPASNKIARVKTQISRLQATLDNLN